MLVAALVSPFDRCCRDDIRISALLTLPHHHGFIVDFPEMHGTVRYLSMDDYAALKAATFDSYRETFIPLTEHDRRRRFGLVDNSHTRKWHMWPENQWQMENLYKLLRSPQKWGKRLKVWHSRLAAGRSARSPVGEPIAATSDDAALFELIYSTGGRMPEA